MKTPKKNRDKRALAEFETYLNSSAEIEEKKCISDLQQAFYANRKLPDDRFWWAVSRRAVRRVLQEARLNKRPAATLFLRLHYPFFDEEVQTILMERHPDEFPMTNEIPWYAVEAYLLAEQYGLTAYDNNPFKTIDLIEGSAQLYFVIDLLWFSRLLQAIADAIKVYQNASIPELDSWKLRLQGWNNRFSEIDESPSQWFGGTEYLTGAKEYSRHSSNKNDRMKSATVIAARTNKERKKIFLKWLPCWGANLQRLDTLLQKSTSSQH